MSSRGCCPGLGRPSGSRPPSAPERRDDQITLAFQKRSLEAQSPINYLWRTKMLLSTIGLTSRLRLLAFDSKATERPSPEIDAKREASSPTAPLGPLARLINWVVSVCRSRTKTSVTPFPSTALRLLASDSKATKRPSAEIEGLDELPSPPGPVAPPVRLTSLISPVRRSRRKTFETPLLSKRLRLSASDWKATKRPSAEIEGRNESPSAATPLI